MVVLEGMDRFSDHYLYSLERLGFTLIDYSKPFKNIVARYPRIAKKYSAFEKNCFLRWIAFKDLFLNSGDQQFWHLDSDVVLHTSLEELAEDTKNKTFMLQGCPALVSIADPTWFQSYESHLCNLDKDIAGYSNEAFARKPACKSRDLELANQSLYRNQLGSDQDLLEYLVSSGQIPQATSREIFDSEYYFCRKSPLSRFVARGPIHRKHLRCDQKRFN